MEGGELFFAVISARNNHKRRQALRRFVFNEDSGLRPPGVLIRYKFFVGAGGARPGRLGDARSDDVVELDAPDGYARLAEKCAAARSASQALQKELYYDSVYCDCARCINTLSCEDRK